MRGGSPGFGKAVSSAENRGVDGKAIAPRVVTAPPIKCRLESRKFMRQKNRENDGTRHRPDDRLGVTGVGSDGAKKNMDQLRMAANGATGSPHRSAGWFKKAEQTDRPSCSVRYDHDVSKRSGAAVFLCAR